MKLIIESGSSKMDWVIIKGRSIIAQGNSNGNNPTIDKEIILPTEIAIYNEKIKSVHFYGSGMGAIDHASQLEEGIYGRFSNLEFLELQSDLLAAARACHGNKEGIIGIMGTGSNIAYYDGKKLIQTSPSLGYILGDEGSAGNIGQIVIRAYFYNQMKKSDQQLFEKHFESDKNIILKKIYSTKKPNKYIANYSNFLIFASSSFKQKVLREAFDSFISARILGLYREYPYDISIVGSIAHHYEEELSKALGKYKLSLKSTLKSPISKLVAYHIESK